MHILVHIHRKFTLFFLMFQVSLSRYSSFMRPRSSPSMPMKAALSQSHQKLPPVFGPLIDGIVCVLP